MPKYNKPVYADEVSTTAGTVSVGVERATFAVTNAPGSTADPAQTLARDYVPPRTTPSGGSAGPATNAPMGSSPTGNAPPVPHAPNPPLNSNSPPKTTPAQTYASVSTKKSLIEGIFSYYRGFQI